jgi:hypothetical protein
MKFPAVTVTNGATIFLRVGALGVGSGVGYGVLRGVGYGVGSILITGRGTSVGRGSTLLVKLLPRVLWSRVM